jgi:radical SAM protein with 4Fe4S-binding SPASM domain
VTFGGEARRLLHPLYRRLETRVHPLRYLFLEITQRCQLACRHCGSDCGATERDGELTEAEWAGVIARVARAFDRREIVVVITGGEPLLAPAWDAVTGALRDHELAWGLVTNGWALDDARLAEALGRGLQSLTVSLDGLRESHDRLRGRAGSWDRATAALARAADASLLFLDAVTCVHPGNLPELPAILELLRSRRVPAWRLVAIYPRGRAAANRDLLLSGTDWLRLLEWIRQTRAAEASGGLDVQFGCEGYLPPDVDRAVRNEPYFCRAGIAIGSVLVDGAISACPNIGRELVQGNVRSDDLVDVWNTRFEPFRDRAWMRRGACAGCQQWRRCQGNSLHLWDGATNDPALCHRAVLGADAGRSAPGVPG